MSLDPKIFTGSGQGTCPLPHRGCSVELTYTWSLQIPGGEILLENAVNPDQYQVQWVSTICLSSMHTPILITALWFPFGGPPLHHFMHCYLDSQPRSLFSFGQGMSTWPHQPMRLCPGNLSSTGGNVDGGDSETWERENGSVSCQISRNSLISFLSTDWFFSNSFLRWLYNMPTY